MTQEQKNQLNDREQFRRYAEAALGGMACNRRTFDTDRQIANAAFDMVTAMMLAESEAFERYQLQATQKAIDEERKRQGIKPPYTDPS